MVEYSFDKLRTACDQNPLPRYAHRSAVNPAPCRSYKPALRITHRCSYGSPISPLLANIVLHRLDQAWQAENRHAGTLVRYCDAFVVVCGTRQQAMAGQRRAATVLAGLGLRLSPEKTRIVELTSWRGKYLSATLAIGQGDEQHPVQDPGAD